MTDLQQKLLEMLKWFHSFCKDNDLRYYAQGGTVLGAIRHQGFIPWDDDIDVGMPRDDYNKFIELMKDKPSNVYELETPLSNKDFVYTYCKVYNVNTTLVEHTRYKTKRGIYLDVFPLDGMGDTEEEMKKRVKFIKSKVNWISAKTCALRKGRKWYKNLAIIFARCIPEFICGWQKTVDRLDKFCAEKSFEDCKYVANAYGAWGEKEVALRETYGQPVEVDFEDAKVYVPQDHDQYLRNLYGDWRQLPPEEKRVTHHDFLEIDLEKPYR